MTLPTGMLTALLFSAPVYGWAEPHLIPTVLMCPVQTEMTGTEFANDVSGHHLPTRERNTAEAQNANFVDQNCSQQVQSTSATGLPNVKPTPSATRTRKKGHYKAIALVGLSIFVAGVIIAVF